MDSETSRLNGGLQMVDKLGFEDFAGSGALGHRRERARWKIFIVLRM